MVLITQRLAATAAPAVVVSVVGLLVVLVRRVKERMEVKVVLVELHILVAEVVEVLV